MSERDIFTAAREMFDPAVRSAYLDRACASDRTLRDRVEALLCAHDRPDSLLDHPAVPKPGPTREFPAAGSDPDAEGTRTLGHGSSAKSDDEVPLTFLAPPGRPDSLGQIGHYEVLQVLGQGGFGIVFRAFDDVLRRTVAVKVLSPQMAATSPARKRFLREARSSAKVRHDNVVQVYEVREQPLPYIAMEFIPGETLQQWLDRVGPVDATEVVRVGRQIAEGLAAAHAMDLIHRDIKPGNILLEGGTQRVKITDFGLARAADDASISQSGIIAGTPMYMAPEQAKGESLDQRADLFSLGSVLYQMVSGRSPFRATGTLAVLKRVAEDTPRPIREIIPETPQWLCDVIAKLHAKKPEDRFQSAREVADVLADCEAQLKANSKLKDFSRIPSSKHGAGQSSRRKWAAAAALLLVRFRFAALGVVLGLAFTYLYRERGSTPIAMLNTSKTGDPPVVLVDPPKQDAPPVVPAADKSSPIQLFNGKDLTDWTMDGGEPGQWAVEEGAIVGRSEHWRKRHYLLSRKEYSNYSLRFEYQLEPLSHAGVAIRAVEGEKLPFAGQFVFDPPMFKLFDVNPTTEGAEITGSSHWVQDGLHNTAPFAQPTLAQGEWHRVEVTVCGDTCIALFNGKKLVDLKLDPNPANYVGCIPGLKRNKGKIGFQVNTGAIHLRNIEIQELSEAN